MGRPSSPSITTRTTRSGQVRFVVRASILGQPRFKKTFRTIEAARRQVAELESGASGLRDLPTSLSPAQLRDAEAASHLLATLNLSFSSAARWLLTNYRAPATLTWAEALRQFLGHLETKGTSSDRRDNVKAAVESLAVHTGRKAVGNPSAVEVETWLRKRAAGKAARTYNHLLADVSGFFRWHVARKTVAEDPCVGIARKPVTRAAPLVLTPDAAAKLMADLEKNHPKWCAFAAILLFAGVRPEGEALRLHQDVVAGEPVVRADGLVIRGKSHGTRLVPLRMCGPLGAWLAAYPVTKETGLIPSSASARREQRDEWNEIRKKHGLTPDVLRHSAATAMLASGKHTLGEIAIALANSEQMLRRHYLNPLHALDASYAAALYAITPTKNNA